MNRRWRAEDGRISIWLLIIIPLALIAFASGFRAGFELARLVVVGLIIVTIVVMVLVRVWRGPPVSR